MTNYKKCNLYVMSFCALALSSTTYASNSSKEEKFGFFENLSFTSVKQRILGGETVSESESKFLPVDSNKSKNVSYEERCREKYSHSPRVKKDQRKEPSTSLLVQESKEYKKEAKKLTGKMKEDNDKIDEIASTGLKIAKEAGGKFTSNWFGSPTLVKVIDNLENIGIKYFTGTGS